MYVIQVNKKPTAKTLSDAISNGFKPDQWVVYTNRDSEVNAITAATEIIKRGDYPANKVRVLKVVATFESDVSVKVPEEESE
ncbi:hypothetical protein SAMN05421503_2437 [Terribacillus aidingensis]|uniref:Uncharacterized protein n=1 Tax=Terribacillus aidingensis TaxID=586416 RepID=A0A285NYF7_9BACI|nr:hypothetical protein [Terribacillus aidingensis]SNZ14515.1 hypothetical protein SAMN05421503_2437 [Terribacillus aidingensis]